MTDWMRIALGSTCAAVVVAGSVATGIQVGRRLSSMVPVTHNPYRDCVAMGNASEYASEVCEPLMGTKP
jgi:hypothetical protein